MDRNKKTILFVIESAFPNYAGGIENWLYNISKILNDRINIIIVSESPVEYKRPMYELPKNVELLNYHSLRSRGKLRFIFRGPIGIIDYRSQKIFMKKTIKKVLECYDVNTIIALNTLNASSAALSFKKQYPAIMYVCCARTMHAEFASSYFPFNRKYFFFQEKKNMLNADEVWSNGYDTQSYYRNLGIDSIVMKNGVDFKRFSIKTKQTPYKEKNVIVSVGTLSEVKGYSYLIKAFSLIKPKYDNVKLYILGKGDATYYQKLANELNVSDSVFFGGHITDVSPYLQNATACACLSGGSGLAMAAIEAMASGVPIVAWETAVYRQFNTKKKTMVLTPYKDVKKLSRKLDDILSNPVLYTDMTNNAKDIAQEYDWDIVCNDILKRV